MEERPGSDYQLKADRYKIEQFPQGSDKKEFLNFLFFHYNAAKAFKDTEGVNERIAYYREMFGTTSGKNYIGTGDSHSYESGVAQGDTRRMTTRLAQRKIFKILAIITDAMPNVTITPDVVDENNDPELAKKLESVGGANGLAKLFQNFWDEWKNKANAEKTIYHCHLGGLRDGGILLNAYYDQKKDGGHGMPVMGILDPVGFVPEPGVSLFENQDYYFYNRRVAPKKAEKDYGEKIVSENIGVSSDTEATNIDRSQKAERGTVGSYDIFVIDSVWKDESCVYAFENGEKASKTDYDKYLEISETGAELPPDLVVNKIELYPYGRLISFTEKGIYRDMPNPYDFDPMEFYTPFSEPYSIWGYSMHEMLSPFNESYDKILQMVMENFERVGNAMIFMKRGVLDNENNKELSDLAAQIIPIDSNASMADIMHVVAPHVIAPDAWRIMELLEANADDTSSINDAATGGSPQSMQSGRAYLALQEATNRMIRLMGRFFENVFEKIAYKIIWLMWKYYEAGRPFNYMDDMGNRTSGKVPLTLRDIEMSIDVHVEPGSSLPKSKQARADLAMSLYEMGLVTAEEVLEAVEWNTQARDIVTQYEMLKQEIQKRIMTETKNDPNAMQNIMSQYPPEIFMSMQMDVDRTRQNVQQSMSPSGAMPEGAAV